MLDLPLAAALLDAVPHNPNLQLVLVGVALLSNMLHLLHLVCLGPHVFMLQGHCCCIERHADCPWLGQRLLQVHTKALTLRIWPFEQVTQISCRQWGPAQCCVTSWSLAWCPSWTCARFSAR